MFILSASPLSNKFFGLHTTLYIIKLYLDENTLTIDMTLNLTQSEQ